jgi:hypothetical protein
VKGERAALRKKVGYGAILALGIFLSVLILATLTRDYDTC